MDYNENGNANPTGEVVEAETKQVSNVAEIPNLLISPARHDELNEIMRRAFHMPSGERTWAGTD